MKSEITGAHCKPGHHSLTHFPKTNLSARLRYFSSKSYELYSWLEYNTEKDKAYCFVCRHYNNDGLRDNMKNL